MDICMNERMKFFFWRNSCIPFDLKEADFISFDSFHFMSEVCIAG